MVKPQEESLFSVVAVQASWMQDVQEMIFTYPYFLQLKPKLLAGIVDFAKYKLKGGLFYYKRSLMIMIHPSPFQADITSRATEHSNGWRSGFVKSYYRLKQEAYSP